MKVTLRQLEIFDAVATLGSVTSAANKLGMSQSAASNALTDLQIVLRRPLFAHAKGRPLQITEEGRRLRPVVRSLLSEVHDLESGLETPLGGTLVVGATEMIAETLLPALCVEFLRLHPGVQIKVEAASATELFERLSRFELETALIEIFPDVAGLELTRWRTDELWLVAAPSHPLATREGLTIADLAGTVWCSREADSTVSARLRYMLHEKVGQIETAFEATSNAAVRLAVIAGGGVGCLSKGIVQPDIEAGRLVRLEVSDFHFTRALSLARPRDVWRSRLTATFDRFILERGEDPRPEPGHAYPSILSIGGMID
ncbi:LysR family transcriptional regulator [Phenylobacterium sp. LjRoot225]|uniref:LysR family transcriptional regulator n=1 Tax=Phenylobacterium sp. LjRoot225 TaxID=3342285 RepID=UPI003ED06B46